MDLNKSATRLSRNPLGIITLFILLIYSFATLLLSFQGKGLEFGQKWCFTIFLIAFPVLVLVDFNILVIFHHTKLYGPYDYRSDDAFFNAISAKEAEKKYEEKVKEDIEIASESEKNKAQNKINVRKQMTDRIEKMEKVEALVFNYYKNNLGFEIEKNMRFVGSGETQYFDGIMERNGVLVFLEIKYLQNEYECQKLLYKTVLKAVSAKASMLRSEKYSKYRFRLDLAVVTKENDSAKIDALKQRIIKMVDTELIEIEVRVFGEKELERAA